ncbi:MAG: hypothetical protein EON47_23345 [Acetobacteraceae bacterium]|nr:MAG: hypothetical protein EON47_23345 [Acetobacteraceae bacterium]
MHHVPVSEIEFTATGDLTVTHLPTGTRYSTYAASNPDEFYVLCHGGRADPELCARVRPMLEQMLRHHRQVKIAEVGRRHGLWR